MEKSIIIPRCLECNGIITCHCVTCSGNFDFYPCMDSFLKEKLKQIVFALRKKSIEIRIWINSLRIYIAPKDNSAVTYNLHCLYTPEWNELVDADFNKRILHVSGFIIDKSESVTKEWSDLYCEKWFKQNFSDMRLICHSKNSVFS